MKNEEEEEKQSFFDVFAYMLFFSLFYSRFRSHSAGVLLTHWYCKLKKITFYSCWFFSFSLPFALNFKILYSCTLLLLLILIFSSSCNVKVVSFHKNAFFFFLFYYPHRDDPMMCCCNQWRPQRWLILTGCLCGGCLPSTSLLCCGASIATGKSSACSNADQMTPFRSKLRKEIAMVFN